MINLNLTDEKLSALFLGSKVFVGNGEISKEDVQVIQRNPNMQKAVEKSLLMSLVSSPESALLSMFIAGFVFGTRYGQQNTSTELDFESNSTTIN